MNELKLKKRDDLWHHKTLIRFFTEVRFSFYLNVKVPRRGRSWAEIHCVLKSQMYKLKINLKKINKNSKKKTNPPMTALDSRGSYSDYRDYHRHSCRDWWSDGPEVLSSFNMNSDTSELLLFSFTDCENYGKAWPLTHFLKTHFINAAVLQNHTGYIRRVSSAILIHFKFNAQPVTKQKSSGRPRAPSTLPPHEKPCSKM